MDSEARKGSYLKTYRRTKINSIPMMMMMTLTMVGMMMVQVMMTIVVSSLIFMKGDGYVMFGQGS